MVRRIKKEDSKSPRRIRYGGGDDGVNKDPRALVLAKKLRQLLLERGWTQAEFTRRALPHAQALGKDEFQRHLINTWLSGQFMPNPINLEIAARTFGIPANELIPEAAVPAEPKQNVRVVFNGVETAQVKLDVELPAEIAMQIMKLVREHAQ